MEALRQNISTCHFYLPMHYVQCIDGWGINMIVGGCMRILDWVIIKIGSSV